MATNGGKFPPSAEASSTAMPKIRELCSLLLLMFSIARVSAASDGIEVYELKRGNFSVKLTNYGAVVVSVILPDRNGKLDDVVLGFDSIEDYKNDTTYFGAIVGRVANRIKGAQFTLNGQKYKLVANDGNNTLHGGPTGFSDVIWQVLSYQMNSHVTFSYYSHDGEEGFPGDLHVSVTYMLLPRNKLVIRMLAKPLNKATPVNLASHSYWNLAGHGSGDILSHQVRLFGDKITPVDVELIPTGELLPVEGTPYDFLNLHEVGSRFQELPGGYDINYALKFAATKRLHKAAEVSESGTGRKMELWTNQPGVQFYTSNTLGSVNGKGGVTYNNYGAICLETQGFPDAVNHPNFPSQIVNPGEIYEHVMVYRFTAQ